MTRHVYQNDLGALCENCYMTCLTLGMVDVIEPSEIDGEDTCANCGTCIGGDKTS